MLFEILHFDWFHIPPIEIAKLSIEVADKKLTMDKTSYEDCCMKKQTAPPKDLFSQGMHEGLKKASETLEQLISDVPNVTLQMFV